MILLNELTHSSVAFSISSGLTALMLWKSTTGMFTEPGTTLCDEGISTGVTPMVAIFDMFSLLQLSWMELS